MTIKEKKELILKIRNDIVREVVKNPRDMENEIKKQLEMLDDEYKKLELKITPILREAKKFHIEHSSLLFFSEVCDASNNNKNIYEKILNNEQLLPSCIDGYFKEAAVRMPQLKNHISHLKTVCYEDKIKYEKEVRRNKLIDLEEEMLRVADDYLKKNSDSKFRNVLKSNDKLRKFSYDEIMDRIKEVDKNLYSSLMVRNIKRIDVIYDYLNKDYSSFEYFLKCNNISEDKFNKLLEEVKKCDVITYQNFLRKYEFEKVKYEKYAEDVLNICNDIINGLDNNDGSKRKYDFLDYNFATDLTINEFLIILKNRIKFNHKDLVKVNSFINEVLPYYNVHSANPEMISDKEIKDNYYGIGGRMITDSEKEKVIEYMDRHNFKRYKKLYEQIVKLYLTDELNLDNRSRSRK
ncbi:MAG: hypothetical protein VZS44_02650 [Bacilli bacterium]|nr:hypothetical protein [Bacilli bacterium]